MSKVYKGGKSSLDFLQPVGKIIFKICHIDPLEEMKWKQYVISLVTINLIWMIWGIILLVYQGRLFLNPAGNPSMELTLATNSAISFLTSINLQHYAGETGVNCFVAIVILNDLLLFLYLIPGSIHERFYLLSKL